MKGARAHPLVGFLAAFAVCLQLLAPTIFGAMQARGIDVARYLCITPGVDPSEEAVEAARRLAVLLGDEAPDDGPSLFDGKCPLCTLVHGAPLPAPFALDAPAAERTDVSFRPYDPDLIAVIRGPPVGATGPPPTI